MTMDEIIQYISTLNKDTQLGNNLHNYQIWEEDNDEKQRTT